MKLSLLKRLGFTLIELLVVITIIGILATLAIPAVTGALVKAQLTGALNNARQLQIVTFNLSTENEQLGQPSAWPGTFSVWVNNLTNALAPQEVRKLLSAPRVSVTNTPTTMADTAFNVYQVANTEDSTAVFLTTRNFNAAQNTAPTATSVPFGDKGVVIMRKGGDGAIVQQRFITDTNATGIVPASTTLAN